MVDSIAQSAAVRDVRERSTKCWGGARGGWWVEVSYGGERWAAWGGAAHLLRSCAFVITFGGLLLMTSWRLGFARQVREVKTSGSEFQLYTGFGDP